MTASQAGRAAARAAVRVEQRARGEERAREADPRQLGIDFDGDDWREATVLEIFGPAETEREAA